jgi:hypothetical protein
MKKRQAIELAMYELRQAGYTINDKVYQSLVTELASLDKPKLTKNSTFEDKVVHMANKMFAEEMANSYFDQQTEDDFHNEGGL